MNRHFKASWALQILRCLLSYCADRQTEKHARTYRTDHVHLGA